MSGYSFAKVLVISKLNTHYDHYSGSVKYFLTFLHELKKRYCFVDYMHVSDYETSSKEKSLWFHPDICIGTNKKYTRFSRYMRFLKRSLLSSKTSTEKCYWEDPLTREQLDAIDNVLCKKKYDIIIVNYTNLCNIFTLKSTKKALKLVLTNDIWSTRRELFAKQGIACPELHYWTKENEIYFLNMADIIVAIQDEEKQKLKRMCPEKQVITMPLSLEMQLSAQEKKSCSDARHILCIAGYSEVNAQGIRYFIEKIFPGIQKKIPNAVFDVYGTVCKLFSDVHNQNIFFHGTVENLKDAYENADIAVVPLLAGTGLKIKFVEALSYSTPVVATTYGIEGCHNAHTVCAFHAPTTQEFIDFSIAILENHKLKERMQYNCSSYVDEYLSPKVAMKELQDVLNTYCVLRDGTPLVSVVMTIFNDAKHLRQAIESILQQTYQHFEFLIINEYGYDDGSLDIIKSFNDQRIIVIQNEQKEGFVASLNKGLQLAKGKYIARMDGDDIAHPKRFEKEVAYLEANPDCGIVSSWYTFFGNRTHTYQGECDDEQLKSDTLFYCHIPHAANMYNVRLFKEYSLNYNNCPVEDHELLSRAIFLFKIHIIQEVLLFYRDWGDNISHTKYDQIQENSVEILCILLSRLKVELPEHLRFCFRPWDTPIATLNPQQIDSIAAEISDLFETIEAQNHKFHVFTPHNLFITLCKKWRELFFNTNNTRAYYSSKYCNTAEKFNQFIHYRMSLVSHREITPNVFSLTFCRYIPLGIQLDTHSGQIFFLKKNITSLAHSLIKTYHITKRIYKKLSHTMEKK